MSELQEKSLQERVTRLEQEVADLQHYNAELNHALANFGIKFPAAQTVNPAPAQPPAQPWNYQTASPGYFPPNFQGYTLQPQQAPIAQQAYAANYSQPAQLPIAPPPQGYSYPAAGRNSKPARPDFDFLRSGEFWLNKIGIGLLLFGVAFLFTYAVDQGWLVPPLRVLCGFIIGLALLGFGLKTHGKRPQFGQVLLGGGIAAFYISIFAAFQLYSLVPYEAAFGAMVLVTALAFGLSIRQSGEMLALIGTIGGLVTPFVLHQGEGSLPGLAGYTCIILAGAVAIYFYRGWNWLLGTAFVGGWIVFAAGLVQANGYYSKATTLDKLGLQAGIIFGWLLFAILPVAREILASRNPERWYRKANQGRQLLIIGILATPVVALLFSASLWRFGQTNTGWMVLGTMTVYALVAWALNPLDAKIAYIHAIAATLMLTAVLLLLLEGDALFLALTLEAVAIQFAAYHRNDERAAAGGLLMFFGLGYWLGFRLLQPNHEAIAIFNVRSLVDLSFIVIVAVAAELVRSRKWENLYYFFAHVAFMGWLWRELSLLPNGNAYVTVAWGVYGGGLLLAGLVWSKAQLARFGFATLLAVVVKLFLVDLANLETLWRVILFLGFGVIFLVLSYFFQDLWKRPTEQLKAENSGLKIKKGF